MNTECMYRINRNKKGASIASCIATLVNTIDFMNEELYPESIAIVKNDTKALSEVYGNHFYYPVRRVNLKAGDIVVFVSGKLHAMYNVGYTSVKLIFPDFDVPFDDAFEDIYQFNYDEKHDYYYEALNALRKAGVI